jgi:hypothetical protein
LRPTTRFFERQESEFRTLTPSLLSLRRNGINEAGEARRKTTPCRISAFCSGLGDARRKKQEKERMVRMRGLEPPRIAPLAPQASVSTSSTTSARINGCCATTNRPNLPPAQTEPRQVHRPAPWQRAQTANHLPRPAFPLAVARDRSRWSALPPCARPCRRASDLSQ